MPGIDYTLGMKTAGFDSGVGGALSKLAGLGAKVAAVTATAGLAAGVGIGALIAKSIGKAADMETLKTAFIPLLGGMEQATARMRELSAFAAATPFELPEIAAASKTLETLTRGALSTGKGLTLVGDIASSTNQPFSEIAVVVGRLYDGLQSGRPVGEVLMRLQELGAVSGETRGKLEDLQKSGASGSAAWAVAEAALSKFSGSMKVQSITWNGLMSTFKDTISQVMVKFGEPIMDALKPYLEGATSRLESFQQVAAMVGEKIGNALRVVQAAFQGGNLMEVAGQGLELGFLTAINTLAKGVQAAMAGAGAALQASGIDITLKALFMGIGNLLAEVLGNAGADLAASLGRSGAAADLRAGAKSSGDRAENYFTTTKAGLASMDTAASAAAGAKAFEDAFGSLPDMIPVEDLRKKFAETMAGLQETAAKNKAEQEAKAAAIAAAVVKPPAPGGAAAEAVAKSTAGRGAPALDRLAQIGGYVGSSSASMASKAAEKTAQWTEKTATLMERLVAMTGRNSELLF